MSPIAGSNPIGVRPRKSLLIRRHRLDGVLRAPGPAQSSAAGAVRGSARAAVSSGVGVHAPVERVTEILADNAAVTELLDNDWLSLTVVDPTRDHRAFDYEEALAWTPTPEESAARAEPRKAPAADD